MRITQGMLNSQMLFDLQNNTSRVAKLENESSTGKKINSPADDPVGVGTVMNENQQIAAYQGYQQNATTAQSWLNNTDSVMSEAGKVMQRARDLAVQGSSGTESPSDRQAIASEVDQLYQQMLSIGNTQYNGSYIFNGNNTTTAPYQGTAAKVSAATTGSGDVLYDLGNGTNMPVSVSGNDFFGSAGSTDNAFSVLSGLKTALQNNDTTGINNALSQIDSRYNKMLNTQAVIGARSDRVQMIQGRLQDATNSMTTVLSNTEDADMASVLTNLQTAQNVQTAALEVGARIITPSLLDFLK